MTQEEFILKYHHNLWGIMLDVSRCKLDGSARSLAESVAMEKIDRTLAAIYRELTAKPEPVKPVPQVNGLPTPQKAVTK